MAGVTRNVPSGQAPHLCRADRQDGGGAESRRRSILGRAAASEIRCPCANPWSFESGLRSGWSLRLGAALVRVPCGRLTLARDPRLDLGVRHGHNAAHGALEPLPGFRAFDVFRFGLHGLIIRASAAWTLAIKSCASSSSKTWTNADGRSTQDICLWSGGSAISLRLTLHAKKSAACKGSSSESLRQSK